MLRALTLLVVLAALEGLARVYRLFVPVPSVEYGYPAGLYAWDPCCEYRLAPGFRGHFTGSAYTEVPIEVNADGFRDAEFREARVQGTERIAFLGDSVTFGAGVAAHERFSDRLRRDGDGGPPRETLNLAVNSYSSWHYAQQARHVVPRFAPDLVVVGLCLNDLEPKHESWPRKHVAAPDGSFVGEYLRPERRERRRTRDLFALVGITSELETRWKNRDPWRTWMKRLGGKWQDPAQRAELRANLVALRDALAEGPGRERSADGAAPRLLVLVLPEAHALADPQRYGAPREQALALLDELGIAHLDVAPDFAADADVASLFLPGDSIHLSPRGHARVAALLEERLRKP